MIRKILSGLLILALMGCICACGSDGNGVNVQRADQLSLTGQAGERYAAMVVSENVSNIRRDSGKAILELRVSLGQEVKAGDVLFVYDSEALALELEKQQLELEKLRNEQVTYAEQQTKLEQQLAYTYNEADKVRLTLEINTLKTTQLENDYNIIAKEKSIAELQTTLENTQVTSPVDGVIRQINEEDGAQSYITIQQQGAYRVKGALNEMSMGNGLMVGSRVRAISRVDSEQFWTGTVSVIDTEAASQDQTDPWNSYGVMDTMTTSSNYVFYVDLDSTDGLLLGQHVYVELAQEQPMEGLRIPEMFIAEYTFLEDTGETVGTVWAVGSNGKLEQRSVTLGMYDGMTGCYEILSGLTAEDYLADPADPGCSAGAAVSHRMASDFNGEAEG